MKKNTVALRMAIYLLAVILVFSAISVLCSTDSSYVYPSEDGVVDLTDFDFGNIVAGIPPDAIHIYDGAFYTPEDFASGNVTQESVDPVGEAPSLGDFGTIRLLLKLPVGKVYAFSTINTSYAQRLFIDGEEYAPIGVTGENAESVTPKTLRYTEAFKAEAEVTEIVLHYSNFVHADTGGFYTLTLGYPNIVTRVEQQRTMRVTVSTVALLTAMLFFFGLFLFFPKNRYLLWFSLDCGCIALRGLLTGNKVLMLFLPDLDWYLAIRMEYLSTCGMALFSFLYLSSLFPGAVNKWAIRGFTAFCALNAAFICFAQPIVFTRYVTPTLVAYVASGVCLLLAVVISIIRKKSKAVLSGPEQILLLAGVFVYLAMSALGISAFSNNFRLWGLDYPQVGMMVYLFLSILALSLGFARTEQELGRTRQNEKEMKETNLMMERLDRLRKNFLANISHEMKTPLTAMKGYALLAVEDIDEGTAGTETQKNLRLLSREAQRLADLATGLLRVTAAADAEMAWERRAFNLDGIFERAAAACRPIAAKNNNRLETRIESGLPPVKVNGDMIQQVLLNLTANANRHTRNGTITFSAGMKGGQIAVTVSDDGRGIRPDILPRVFERGVSGGGGDGLGLAICKDIVEAHGGKVTIESASGEGTHVTFTLPGEEEAEDGANHTDD